MNENNKEVDAPGCAGLAIKDAALPDAPMTTDQAREYLIEFMERHFTDTTFHRYIRANPVDRNRLAGDFAWQMATALRALAQAAPASPNMISEDDLASLLPGSYYMDPPDGGSVSVMEQLRRMADDAAKYRDHVQSTHASRLAIIRDSGNQQLIDDVRNWRVSISAAVKAASPASAPVASGDALTDPAICDMFRLMRLTEHGCAKYAKVIDAYAARAALAVKVEAQQAGVPEGWKALPPTLDDHLLRAAISGFRPALNEMTGSDGYVASKTYAAIFAAAPLPPVVARKVLTNQEIRTLMHNYSRMHQPGHYSDTEFDCLQDVIAFVRAAIERHLIGGE